MNGEAVHADALHDVDELAETVRRLLGPFAGSEIALDAGCGSGALAFALARFVGEVVGVDADRDALDAASAAAPPNVRLVEGDVTALPFDLGTFDIAACRGVLHHVRRPELVVSELARVTRLGGRVLIVDQLGSIDPLRSLEMDRFLRRQDPKHQRLLPDADIRGYLDANDLVLVTHEVTRHRVAWGQGAGGDGGTPSLQGPAPLEVEVGWYVARKPVPT
ncbi:MAG: class I SAM-dependent methyltransferase [Thermoleophilia bacterium]|nr:class I SAM-dependent methyltransferase [Gaiellaceae bacterium]MDW8338844.1 class I SAM-dependent methyltransferase [Thermoleophilia bacterium]